MADLGFRGAVHNNGDVVVRHHDRRATTLRGGRAAEFPDDADPNAPQDVQEDLARLTGNYKRGNERDARSHPRTQP